MAFVIAVGDEAQRKRKAREHQRPRIQVGDRAAVAEADPGHSVMEVLAVGAVDGLPVLQALEHHEGGVQEWNGEQDERQHEGHHRRRLDRCLNGYHAHQQTEQVRSAVTHEAGSGREVVEQEAEGGAGGQRGEHGRLLAVQVEGDDRHRRGDDHAHSRGQAIHAVGEVDHVHHRHKTDDRQNRARVGDARVGEGQFADERQRDRLHRHAEVHDDDRREHLAEQLDRRRQVEAVVDGPHERDHRRRQQHAVPQLVLVFVSGHVARGKPDQSGHQRAREDRKAPQQRRGPMREAALARIIDRADGPGQALGERCEHRGHRRRYQEGVKRVELVRMRHRLLQSIAGCEVGSDATPRGAPQRLVRA